MAFSSMTFLCVFFPLTLIIYYIIPKKATTMRNIYLMVVSLLFYAYGEPVYVLLMLFSTFWNYIITYLFSTREGNIRKILLIAACVVDLSVLGVFKYTGMLLDSINSIMQLNITVPDIALPIGISFFTFQAMSYTIDVYRGNAKAEKNFFKVLLYISFFPQLIAGPIVKYTDIADEIDNRSVDAEEIAKGIRRFILGLSKKVIISNALGLAVDTIYALDSSRIGMLTAWIAAISYMMQIFFDFSGYSDMAIGLGRMFGFHFRENFDYPYVASTIQMFWRKWHISLTNWFREYLYIPLGGNRKGKTRTWINRLIVFFFTGLWHGASWNFVFWGLYHGLFLTLETIITEDRMKKIPKIIRHIYVLLVVCIGFVFFRAETMSQALDMVHAMFAKPLWTSVIAASTMEVINGMLIFALVLSVIFMFPVKPMIADKVMRMENQKAKTFYTGLSYVLSLILLFVCIMNLAGNTYNPFIYFRF